MSQAEEGLSSTTCINPLLLVGASEGMIVKHRCRKLEIISNQFGVCSPRKVKPTVSLFGLYHLRANSLAMQRSDIDTVAAVHGDGGCV